jgi:hypothetical protein
VASAEHVAIGRAQGFMQVGHGKGAPLRRLHAGDRVAYYSPVRVFGSKAPCQAFTAIGTVRDERVYQGVMAGGFEPFRRDVDWCDMAPGDGVPSPPAERVHGRLGAARRRPCLAHEAPIRPLLALLSFTAGKPNWGYALRFGLLAVSADDMALIANAMHARAAA